MRSQSLVRALVIAACVAAVACGDSRSDPPPTPGPGPTVDNPDLGANPTLTPDPGEQACAMVSSVGTLAKGPVDIIFVIDNSGSMTDEIQAVEANLNASFAQIIGASGLDYRIIMLSAFGSASVDQSICIAAPLSGDSCVPPLPRTPTNGTRYFHHSLEIGSHNSFERILGDLDTWGQWLRPNAAKVFVEITDDDDTSMSYTAFDSALLSRAPHQFGTESQRNYIFHAITGVAQKANPVEAYQPTEPLVPIDNKCASSENSGPSFQNLAMMTGGLRFPICDPSKFSTVFQVIAQGVVEGARVACELAVPTVAEPASIDLAKTRIEYQPSTGGAPQSFTQVADAASCAPGAFYVAAGGTKVVLCPDACTMVQDDPRATVQVFFECTWPIP